MHSFLTLAVGAFVGVCGPLLCAEALLCLCPRLGVSAQGQSTQGQFPLSCHYRNSCSHLVKGAISWHVLLSPKYLVVHLRPYTMSKEIRVNFTTLKPT